MREELDDGGQHRFRFPSIKNRTIWIPPTNGPESSTLQSNQDAHLCDQDAHLSGEHSLTLFALCHKIRWGGLENSMIYFSTLFRGCDDLPFAYNCDAVM